jgi:hypothetical protein
VPIRVATALGTSTETPIGAPIAARSCARHSVAASAANFDTLYGAVNGVEQIPAIETVFTMCDGRPAAIIRGTNALMPCRMPHRLTPSVHSKSLAGRSQMRPPAKTPALLQRTSTRSCVTNT